MLSLLTCPRCDTLAKQKAYINANGSTLGTPENAALLDKIYAYTFNLLLQDPRQKSADKAMCVDMWQPLLTAPSLNWATPRHNWLQLWIGFLTGPTCTAKGVSRDLWNHVLKFARKTLQDESLGWHSEEQSWPALLDEFVEYVRAKDAETHAVAGAEAPADNDGMEF
jgi:DCN1-like protein 1/2